MNRDEALRRFTKENLPFLTSPDFEKSRFKSLLRDAFLSQRRQFGIPSQKDVCEVLVEVLLRAGTAVAEIECHIRTLPVFRDIGTTNQDALIHDAQSGRYTSYLDPATLATLRKADVYEAVKQNKEKELTEELQAKKAALVDELKETSAQLLHKRTEVEQARKEHEDIYTSILDEEVAPEPDFDPNVENIKPWWERFYLRGNPFPNKAGLALIAEDLYEAVVVKTKPFRLVLGALQRDPNYLFNTAFLVMGDYGVGKTTFMEYLSYYLIHKDILPVRITCRKPSADYSAFLDNFYIRLKTHLEEEMVHLQMRPQSNAASWDTVDQIINLCRTITSNRRKGILVFLDDYHKHDEEYPAVYDFLGALQVLKDDLALQGIPVGFMVAGHTRWKSIMAQKQQMSGFFDSAPIEMPPIEPEDVCAVFNQRIRAYSFDESPREIKMEFVHHVFTEVGRRGSYRDYLNRITVSLEENPYAIVNTPIEITDDEREVVRQRLERDDKVKEGFTALVKLSTFKKYTREQIAKCLELLVQTTVHKGVMEDDRLFRENQFYFQRLRESGLIQQQKAHIGKRKAFKWVPAKALQRAFDDVRSEHRRSPCDYLLKIYAFKGYGETEPVRVAPENDKLVSLKSFFSGTHIDLPPSARDNLQRAFQRFDSVQMARREEPREAVLEHGLEALTALSLAFFELDGALVYFNDASVRALDDRWRLHWFDDESVHEFLSRWRTYQAARNRTHLELALKQLSDAFVSVAEELRDLVEDQCGANRSIPYMHSAIHHTDRGRDVFDLVRKNCCSAQRQAHFEYVKNVTDYLEERLRAFLYLTSVLSFGPNKYFNHVPEADKSYARRNMEQRNHLSPVKNLYKGLTRPQFRMLFEQPTPLKSLVLDNLGLPWTSADWRMFFDVFAVRNIDSSHNQDDAYTPQERSEYLRYCAMVEEITTRMNSLMALLGLCGDLSLIGIAVPRLTANKYRAFRGIRAGIAFRSVASPWFSQVFHSKPLVFNGLRDVASFHPAENPPVNPEAPV